MGEKSNPQIEWTPEMDREFDKQSGGVTHTGGAREAALKAGGYEVTSDLASNGSLINNSSSNRSRVGLSSDGLRAADAEPKPEDSLSRRPTAANRASAEESLLGAEQARRWFEDHPKAGAQT